MNYLELSNNIVHADCGTGHDYLLCGLSAINTIDSPKDYKPEEESELTPYLCKTRRKITCPTCIMTIRHCIKLGLRSIDKEVKI